MRDSWEEIRARPKAPEEHIGDLGWMETDAYLAFAERSLLRQVVTPLRQRGIPVRVGGAAR